MVQFLIQKEKVEGVVWKMLVIGSFKGFHLVENVRAIGADIDRPSLDT